MSNTAAACACVGGERGVFVSLREFSSRISLFSAALSTLRRDEGIHPVAGARKRARGIPRASAWTPHTDGNGSHGGGRCTHVTSLREGSLGPGAERGSLGADVDPCALRVAVKHFAGDAVADLVGELVVHEEALELLVELGGVRGGFRGGLGDDGARRDLASRGDGGDGARSLAGEERSARAGPRS